MMGLKDVVRGGWLALLLCGLSACGSDDEGDEGSADTSGSSLLPLKWMSCGQVECANVRVPIDYDRPDAGALGIAINRVRSLTPERRGVVLVNPGGPGVSGKEFLVAAAPVLREWLPGFDFVGFDPRGVGGSSPLACRSEGDLLAALNTGGAEAVQALLRGSSSNCAQLNGALFQHLGSNQVVADMDRIRQGLGVEEINFLGISYGTRFGALYAQAFPEHARAVVLDAPVSPVADSSEMTEAQFDALLQAHTRFFADCATGVLSCPPDPQAAFDALVASQPTDLAREVFLTNWELYLAFPPGRARLADFLSQFASGQAMEIPDMPVMTMLAQAVTLFTFTNRTTLCADNDVPSPTGEDAEALVASFRERSPLFKNKVLAALMCGGWQVQPDPVPALDFTPRVPLLVIGGTADSLTPIQWAEDTLAQLPSSSLLLSEHYGHGAFGSASQCVIDHVRAYFNDLTPVPAGTTCAAP